MKFSIQRNNLLDALQKIIPVVPPRSTVAITMNILLEAEGDELILSATDLEITLSARVKANVIENGKLAVPGKLFHEVIRELPDTEIYFEGMPNFRLLMSTDFGEYKLAGEDPERFPRKPTLEAGVELALPNDVFRTLIERTIFAASTDDLRPALTGVYFEIQQGTVRAVATDGHSLSFMEATNVPYEGEPLEAIFSRQGLNVILRNLAPEGNCSIVLGQQHAYLKFDESEMYLRLIDGKFIDYNRVIPKETKFEALMDTEQFASAVKRVALFTHPLSLQVVLEIKRDSMEIRAEDIEIGGAARERIPCEFTGEDFIIGFNAKFLQDAIKHITSAQTVLKVNETSTPAIFQPAEIEEGYNQLILIMPVRLG